MFDLRKRNCLTLNSHESEEFRRAAVRRKFKGAEEECHAVQNTAVSSGVSGSYSCDRACDPVNGSEPNCQPCADGGEERSLDKESPFKLLVPLKPAHLQSPLRAGPAQVNNPTTGKLLSQNSTCGCGVSITCCSPTQSCLNSPSPVRGGGNYFLNISGGHIGAARPALGISTLTSSPRLGSPSPGKRSIKNDSPSREGGCTPSPNKLSPKNPSPLTRKLRTPSPVQGRLGGCSPSRRNSKSWVGLNRISGSKREGQQKIRGKSLSLPNLVLFLKENRIPTEKAEHSPPKRRQSPNCRGPANTIKAPVDCALNDSTNEPHLSSNGKEHSPGKMSEMVQGKDQTVVNGTGINVKMEEGKIPIGCDSKFSCKWDEANTEDGRVHKESKDEEKETGGGELKDQGNGEQKLFRIANELLQTERAYVARLHLLDQVFRTRLTEEAGRGSFPPEVIRNIFSNIPSIYSFHSQFLLPDLEKCISHWNESPGLGSVLHQYAPLLRMYADYVSNFDQAMELVRTWTERSSAFRNIIQDIQSQEVCGSLTMQHHMLEPVQRVPRYEMLLRDYLKKLPKDNPDYELAQKSLHNISMAATHSNSAIHKAESLKRLLEIYEMVGEEAVVNPTNLFLREGRLLKLAARNTAAKETHLFLFNNFLLCCTPKFSLVGQRFTLRCMIGVDGMQVQQTSNEDHYTFQVSGKGKTLELQASSEKDRDDWIKVIREAIDVFHQNIETLKLDSKELNGVEATEELGRRAPRWIRDNEVTLCMECQEPFNALTRRRHHCKACGHVVCGKCSDNKVALEYDNNKMNKVCKACYFLLTAGKKRRSLESAASKISNESLMSSFLMYGCNPKTWQRVWSVIPRTEPTVLYLYTAPQDEKPLSCIPLVGSSVEDSPHDLQGQLCFCLRQSQTDHTFSCDDLDLKQTWLTFLKDAVTGTCTTGDNDIPNNGSGCGMNGNVSNGSASSSEFPPENVLVKVVTAQGHWRRGAMRHSEDWGGILLKDANAE